MPQISRSQLVAYAAFAVLVVALGVRFMHGRGAASAPPAASPVAAAPERSPGDGGVSVSRPAPAGSIVHVAGAVREPGVYKLAADARVDEAVARAGGPTRRADLSGLNLAAKVEDGRQVLVPERAAGGSSPGTASAASAAMPAEGQPVNLNTATLEQLDTLSGIGPLTAQKILDFREERGGFSSIEELGEIPGIGDKRLATLREEVTL